MFLQAKSGSDIAFGTRIPEFDAFYSCLDAKIMTQDPKKKSRGSIARPQNNGPCMANAFYSGYWAIVLGHYFAIPSYSNGLSRRSPRAP